MRMDTFREPTLKIVFACLLIMVQLVSKFFPFREDPFSERAWCVRKQKGSHNSFLPFKTRGPSGPEIAHLELVDHDMLHCAIRSNCL